MPIPTALTPRDPAPPRLRPPTLDLISASAAPSTRRAYRGALARLGTWLEHTQRPLDDAAVADYLADLHARGKAPATSAMLLAALRQYARTHRLPSPIGPLTQHTLNGIRRQGRDRGRGQSAALEYHHVCAIFATATTPRPRGRGRETPAVAQRRGTLDKAIVALLFQAGLRRAEAAALTWREVTEAPNGGLLVQVRHSKTNPYGTAADYRLLTKQFAAALRTLQANTDATPGRPVLGGLCAKSLGNRLRAAARHAGLQTAKITAHSGRIGLAVTLTVRGASTTEIQLAGGWATARMVAHYAAAAHVEHGAIAKYF